jgi:osmotically-inducible protein OsmY
MRLPMRPSRPVLAVAVCAAVLGGCASGNDGAAPEPTQDRPAPTSSPTGDATVEAAPSTAPTDTGEGEATTLLTVSGRSLDGGEIDLGSFAGDHLVLWMWAPW